MPAPHHEELNALFLRALAERVRRPDRLSVLAADMLTRADGDARWLARADILRGWGLAFRGEFAAAEAAALQAAHVLHGGADPAGLAASRDLLAVCLTQRGAYAEVPPTLEPTLAMPPESRAQLEWSVTYARLAVVNERLGLFDDALRWHYRAIAAAHAWGDPANEALLLGALGGLQLSVQNLDGAAALLDAAWSLAGDAGTEWVYTWSVVAVNRLMVLTHQGHFAEALLLAETIVHAEPGLPPAMRSKRKLLLAHAYSSAGRFDRAQRFLDEGLALSRKSAAPPVEWVWIQARIWNHGNRHAEALRVCQAHFDAAAAGTLADMPAPEDLVRLHSEATIAHEALCDLAGALRSQRAMIAAERELVSAAARARRTTLQVQFELDTAQRDRDDAQRREQAAEREQARLAELNTALHAANEAKTRFLAAASHDLRQPVAALTMYMAAIKLEDRPEQRDGLMTRMEQSLHALSGMFDVLLDLSHLDAGMVNVNPTPLRLDTLLERLVDEHCLRAQERGLGLRLHLPHGAKAPCTATDAVLLEGCLRNLIDNALKYTERGGVVVRLKAPTDAVPGWRVEVRDTGPGIAPELQQQVFEEFFQVGNEERDRAKGLGLGLSIVRRVAALLGHPLGLRSAPGRGSCFSIELPRLEWHASGEPAARELRVSDRRLALIVIDDDADVRDSLVSVLERWGHHVFPGTDADQALAAWRRAGQPPVDGALVDLRLRGGATGLEMIALLRQHMGPGLQALVITGDIAPQRLAQLSAAAQPWLPKPVMPMRLRSWLRSLGPAVSAGVAENARATVAAPASAQRR